MTISKINIHRLSDKERLIYGNRCLGLADIIFDMDFIVHNIQIMSGKKGEYLVFPINKLGAKLAFPINNEFRQYILNEILKKLGELNED